jgi:hypothetical protein
MAFRHVYPLDHATHIPFLIGISKTFPHIRNILEYGAGFYSTPLFLNKRAFPNVERVVSVELIELWARQVSVACTDPRLTIIQEEILPTPDVDLIFIDSGQTEEQRSSTIRKVVPGFSGITVLHDTERYEDVTRGLWAYRYDFEVYIPKTTAANGRSLPVAWVDNFVRKHSDIPPDDVDAWLKVYETHKL